MTKLVGQPRIPKPAIVGKNSVVEQSEGEFALKTKEPKKQNFREEERKGASFIAHVSLKVLSKIVSRERLGTEFLAQAFKVQRKGLVDGQELIRFDRKPIVRTPNIPQVPALS